MQLVTRSIAGLMLAGSPFMVVAQDRPADAGPQAPVPTGTMPTGTMPSGTMMSAPAEMQADVPAPAMAADSSPPSAPAYGLVEQLRATVEQQHDYIGRLEKHVAELDAYIAVIRGRTH